jgi:hypothetical protein
MRNKILPAGSFLLFLEQFCGRRQLRRHDERRAPLIALRAFHPRAKVDGKEVEIATQAFAAQ